MQQKKLTMWIETARPRTLPLAVASILTGVALSYSQGHFNFMVSFLCLMSAILLQILSNFANDYGDYIKGSDTTERIGPLRAIQKGGITRSQLKNNLIQLVIANIVIGGVLIVVACNKWNDLLSFLLLGISAIFASITYTVGKKPYGYMGLGDLSVLVFFGFLGVGGTYYLQSHYLTTAMLLPSLGCGLLAVAVLNINNLRDVEQDKQSGKTTLVVRLGAKKGRIYHALLIVVAILCYLIYANLHFSQWMSYVFIVMIPFLIKHIVFVLKNYEPLALRPMLGQMVMLALFSNLLFSIGLMIG